MNDIRQAPIHIFYSPEYPNGYTTAPTNREAAKVAVELMRRTGSPVSIFGGMKSWKNGKYALWIVQIEQPFRDQLQGGYVVQTMVG